MNVFNWRFLRQTGTGGQQVGGLGKKDSWLSHLMQFGDMTSSPNWLGHSISKQTTSPVSRQVQYCVQPSWNPAPR